MISKFEFLKEAFANPGRLSEEEELDLLKKFQQGDTIAYGKLRLSLRPLVEKAIVDATPSGNTVSASVLRMKAETEMRKILQDFDPYQGTKLKTYILSRLKGYLRNAVADNVSGPYVPRNQQTDLNRYKQAVRDAQMEFGRNATEDQIRQFYPENEASTSFDKIKTYNVKSFMSDAKFGEDDDGNEMTFNDQFTTGTAISRDDLMSDIYKNEEDELIKKTFNPTEQKIIQLVTKDGQPFVQAALSIGTTTGEVRKVIRQWHDLTQKNK